MGVETKMILVSVCADEDRMVQTMTTYGMTFYFLGKKKNFQTIFWELGVPGNISIIK